jgi:hypothetical protein
MLPAPRPTAPVFLPSDMQNKIRPVLFGALALLSGLSCLHAQPESPYAGKMGINIGADQRYAFTDIARSANPWDDGNTPLPPALLDENGWPKSNFRTVLMDERPVAEWSNAIDDPDQYRINMAGTYKARFNGRADIRNIGGSWSIQNQVYDEAGNTTTFDLVIPAPAANHGLVIMNFENTRRSPADPINSGITNLRIMKPGYGVDSDVVFDPKYLDMLGSVEWAVIRSQSLPRSTGWDIAYPRQYTWAARKMPGYALQGGAAGPHLEGAAWEYFIDLCNRTNADLWVCVPISASDDYVTGLAELIRDRLDPELNIYVENDNEVWNSAPAFIGTWNYNNDEADDLGISFEQNIARRAVELSQLFAGVFGQDAINDRVRVVLASHAPMLKWWVQPMLNYISSNFGPPKNYLWAISRQGYFSVENPEGNKTVSQLLGALMEDIDQQVGPDPVNEANRRQWIAAADQWELPGGCNFYEAGPHTPASGGTDNLGNQIRMHRHAGMKTALQYNYANNWFDLGGELALHFTLFSKYTRYGCWGLTDDPYNPDRNQKMAALRNLEYVITALDPTQRDAELRAYPNPARNWIQLEADGAWPERISVRDLQGRERIQQAWQGEETLLPLDGLAPGLYLLRVEGRGRTAIRRVAVR